MPNPPKPPAQMLMFGDTHIGMLGGDTEAMERGTRMHAQLEAYATLGGVDHAAFVVYCGGDVIGEPLYTGPDTITIDQDGNRIAIDYKMDYAGLEARILASMLHHERYGVGRDKVCVVDIETRGAEILDEFNRAYPAIAVLHSKLSRKIADEPPSVKPARQPRKRDWEQRNRKRRR